MPELPDVEAFRAIAEHRFLDKAVSRVIVPDPDSLEGTNAAALQRRMKGRTLQSTGRHGKYLFLDFGQDTVLVMHFGPAGELRFVSAGADLPDYVRFQIEFSNGDNLAYVNRRRIGRVRLADNAASFIEHARLGPDALDPELDLAKFEALIGGRDRPIKVVLNDQSILSGIGNTWSDEILFQARINPATRTGNLEEAQTKRLFRAMRDVLQKAIDLDPARDDFRERLPAAFLLPHRHPGGHCPRCGNALERISVGGHTSTFCPHCQPSTVHRTVE